MTRRTLIVKEAYPYVAVFALLAGLGAWCVGISWSVIPGTLALYTAYFFRNPPRPIKLDDKNILSPADGKVVGITNVSEDKFLNCEGIKITIFLSVFDVHVNRSPIAGVIKYQEYSCGRFLPAYKDSVGWENERHTIGVEDAGLRILVTQIAGVLARRIVSWVPLGGLLEQGQLYGMIKFGSCTEIIMPKEVVVQVKKGDRVKGGITILGRRSN